MVVERRSYKHFRQHPFVTIMSRDTIFTSVEAPRNCLFWRPQRRRLGVDNVYCAAVQLDVGRHDSHLCVALLRRRGLFSLAFCRLSIFSSSRTWIPIVVSLFDLANDCDESCQWLMTGKGIEKESMNSYLPPIPAPSLRHQCPKALRHRRPHRAELFQ